MIGGIFIPVQAQHYLWPTDSGRFLSSTFGETRAAHFHAGLDIKTWGREGYKVFAAKSGKVHKLLVTERGYGKAIYLKHPDNTFTVYAHLQRFNNELQTLTDSARLTDHSFEIELNIESLDIQIQQGDVIGYTGSSGIGPPHLHFEVRDSLDNPVNALSTNLSVKDELAPIFNSLIIEPLESTSRVDGHPYSRTIPVQSQKDGIYDFGTVSLNGQHGLAVNVHDVANDVYNKYAVYALTLMHESDTLFHQQLNSFNYEERSQMYLDRISSFGGTRRNHHRLYEKEGARRNPFYLHADPNAKIRADRLPKTYLIIASDYFGNQSKATVTVQNGTSFVNENPAIGNPLKDWYWTENWASPDLRNSLDLRNASFGAAWKENRRLLYTDSNNAINFARIKPESGTVVSTPDHRLMVRFGPETFFDTLTVATGYHQENGEFFLTVQPEMLPTQKEFKIEFFLGDEFQAEKNYQLFRIKKDKKKPSYVKSELKGRTVHARPSGMGEFVIMADDDPPQISRFRIMKTDYGQWLGIVNSKDELSGVDATSADFRINGIRGIAEYDYEEELLIYYLPNFIPKDHNTAKITVKDKAGNQTVVQFND